MGFGTSVLHFRHPIVPLRALVSLRLSVNLELKLNGFDLPNMATTQHDGINPYAAADLLRKAMLQK